MDEKEEAYEAIEEIDEPDKKKEAAYKAGFKHGAKNGYRKGFSECAELEMRHRLKLEEQVKKLCELHAAIANPPPVLACADCPKIKLRGGEKDGIHAQGFRDGISAANKRIEKLEADKARLIERTGKLTGQVDELLQQLREEINSARRKREGRV